MSSQIPVFKPLIEKEEIAAAVESLELGWLGMGSYVKQFEEAVAQVCSLSPNGNRYVVAVSTGHAALHLSLLMMGIGPGDEVITPSFNNAADFQAIRACGAEPVFVDIDENTLCIDPSKIEELITEKTKCIIAMDYDIFVCDHESLAHISRSLVYQFSMMLLIRLGRNMGMYLSAISINTRCLALIPLSQLHALMEVQL